MSQKGTKYKAILVPTFLDYSYEHLKKEQNTMEQNTMFLRVDIEHLVFMPR